MNKQTLKVLLVDGDVHEKEELCRKLGESRNTSFLVESTDKLPQCLALLRSGRFDAVLMDLTVPGSSGIASHV